MNNSPENWLKEFEESETHKIIDIIWDLLIYHEIVKCNFERLVKVTDDNEIFWSKNPLKPPSKKWREEYHLKIEFISTIHNYLMSVYSLREKTEGWKRHLNKHLENFVSEEKYEKELQKSRIEEDYKQIRRIRNDFAHKTDIEGFRQIDLRYFESPNGIIAKLAFREISPDIKNFLNSFHKSFLNFVKWVIIEIVEGTNKLLTEDEAHLVNNLKF